MTFTELELPGVWKIEPTVFTDHRGYFFESFRNDLMEQHLGLIHFVQDNQSSSSRGVVRGLHYQLPPHAQSKLIRVVEGSIVDVCVDIRRGSATFGQHVAVHLNSEQHHQLFIPKGFAHGFVTLSERAIVLYRTDDYYAPETERCIRFDDPEIGIDWKFERHELIISEKDLDGKLLKVADVFEEGSW